MKVCLVNPRLRHGVFKAIPHGLLSLCATLKKAGHTCHIRDYNMDDYSGDGLGDYDVVGLSVFTSQLPHAVSLAAGIPASTRVVWGGVHCLLDPLSILDRFPGHYVISGEGEIPLARLLESFASGAADLESVPGLSYVRGDGPKSNGAFFHPELDSLPDIDYYDLPGFERYIQVYNYCLGRRLRTLKAITGRGCPWNCTFCINAVFHRHRARHRAKSFEKVRRETERVICDLNIEDFSPRDDDFFSNREMVDQWAEFCGSRGLLWSATARYNYIREDWINAPKLREMAGSGLYCLGMALEAGDEGLRNNILNKKIQDRQVRRAVEIIRESGAATAVNTSFVVYFPGDTLSNRIQNIQWMDYLSRSINVVFSGPQVYRAYPGTRLYELEKDRVNGSLDYYLENMTGDGCLFSSPPEDANRMEFFSETILSFFNTRYRILARDPANGALYRTDKGHFPLFGALLKVLFLPVRLRLRLDYWGFFAESWLIGSLYRLAKGPLKTLIRKLLR